MRSRLVKLMVAVALVAMAIPSFAAVENVKVGGEIDVKMLYRDGFDFGAFDLDTTTFTYIGTKVYLAAELTDNVSAMIQLINERDFGNDYLREIEGSLIVDQAYVKLADLMVPGLNLTVGRQEIQLGEGLVVGSRYRMIDYVGADIGTVALDLGQQKAFDALKIDYAFPATDLTMTAFKAKILETYGILDPLVGVDDLDLYGLAVKYDNGRLCVEPYFVYLRLANPDVDLMTLGARAGFSPMDSLKLKLELAKQFGDQDLTGSDFNGWAALLGGSYTFAGASEPTLSLGLMYLTGQDLGEADVEAWVPVFPSNVASRVGKIAYPTLFQAGDGLGALSLVNGTTGLQVINIGFGMKPAEKVALDVDFYNLKALETPTGIDKGLGNEIDLSMKYMYTEDVSFGVDLGILLAGDNIDDLLGDSDNPWQLIGSMKVAF